MMGLPTPQSWLLILRFSVCFSSMLRACIN